MKKAKIQQKKNMSPSPRVNEALKQYFGLKQRLHRYFFENCPLKITSTEAIAAYTAVFVLINENSDDKIKDDKKYESYDDSLLKQYTSDLIEFAFKCKNLIQNQKGMPSQDFLQYISQIIFNYNRFMRWILRTFLAIQRNCQNTKSTNLHFQGLKILKVGLIQPIYDDLFELCIDCLEEFKQNKLISFQPLQQIIQFIGKCGYTKYRYVSLQIIGQNYQFISKNSKQNQQVEIPYETDYFKTNFTNRLVKYLKNKYKIITNQLILLSTPQYVEKALDIISKEEKTADCFYANKNCKNLVIRSIDEVLAHQRVNELIDNKKTGLFSMLDNQRITQAKRLYDLIKRSSNFKIFTKKYQQYIEWKGEELLEKVTSEQQQIAKKQIVNTTILQLYKLHEKITHLTSLMFHNDIEVQASATQAYQRFSNKSDKVCNFLAYYADNILHKQQSTLNNNQNELIQIVSKLSKYLYSYDCFLKTYQKLLGLRILYDNFKNREIQYSLINIMKNQAGVTALNKISCMISDYKISQTFNLNKSQSINSNLSFNFHVMMLTSGSWPINDPKNGKQSIPIELIYAVQKYQKIYHQTYPQRQITWIFSYGRAIVKVKMNQEKIYLLIINNYQLLTLLYLQRKNFNRVKISDLYSELKIDDQSAFNASIMMILKVGVLVKEGNPYRITSKSQTISFNNNFSHKVTKVACFQIPRYVERTASSSNSELTIERNYIVDAAIVKIMKTKRQLSYADLIIQVQKMCKTFKTQIGFIKKRIENCQQRDFLERDANDMNKIIYKP